jgi:hypothetical protein
MEDNENEEWQFICTSERKTVLCTYKEQIALQLFLKVCIIIY